jgi:hypothetical protein
MADNVLSFNKKKNSFQFRPFDLRLMVEIENCVTNTINYRKMLFSKNFLMQEREE